MKSIIPKIHRLLISLVLFTCVLMCGQAFSDQTNKKEAILSAIEQKYANKSFEAQFTQISTLAALDIKEKASGIASFSHPGKMRWEYKEPETHKIITNGKTLWIFRPEEEQVMIGDATQFFKAGAGGAFLSDISLIRKNYDTHIKEETDHYTALELTNKTPGSDITLIVIRVSKKTHEIEQVLTTNPYNDTTLFELSHTQFKDIDPGSFEFKIPAGVTVIEME